jgi:transcriptional regulator with XRE-family HTH domain
MYYCGQISFCSLNYIVNMTINDKIKQILIDKNLSPSYFADEIGVQRSSISHILSGRNRPSFDIIQKVIRRFPELGYDWIMEDDSPTFGQAGLNPDTAGQNPMGYTTPPIQFVQRGRPPMPPALSEPQPNGRDSRINPNTILESVAQPAQTGSTAGLTLSDTATEQTAGTFAKPSAEVTSRQIERILVFYTDGTFRDFLPTATGG